jgi:tetratricopeptide (TPR) repeat protein
MGQGGAGSLSAANAAAQQQERTLRLEEAQKLYTQVITELEARPEPSLSDLERLYHRNAFFYRADCAYNLGRFEQAIELYDVAARKWERDPASLVALVQIVNAYGELGMVQEAKAANRRAQDQQRRIPEEAFNDPNLPMSRRHWEEWLKWTEELKLFEPAGAAGAAGAVHTQQAAAEEK